MRYPMLREVLSSLVRRPATVVGPAKVRMPEGFRGSPYLAVPSACTSCGLCARDCPSVCITLEAVADEVSGRQASVGSDAGATPRIRKLPVFHLDECAFCGQCQDSCARKAIRMHGTWDEAAWTREAMVRKPSAGALAKQVEVARKSDR